jgi:hypothetical protein
MTKHSRVRAARFRPRTSREARAIGATLLLVAGCGNFEGERRSDEVASPTQSSALTVLSRTGWTATASTSGGTNVAGNAVDTSASTRWRAGASQANNQWFQVDMISVRTFTEIRMDSGTTTTEFPRTFKVQATNDNTTAGWTAAPILATGTGTSAVTTVAFAGQTARYVRVTLTASDAAFWSIHDFNVYGTALSRSNWTATASSTNGSNVAQNGLDGSTTTRWTSAGAQTGQWYRIDMKSPQTFNQIVLDAGTTTTNFPRGYSVQVANDDSNWATAPTVVTGTGSNALTVITFAVQRAQFIRINQTQTNTTPWSIQEVSVEGQPTSPTPQPRAGWIPSASSTPSTVLEAVDDNPTTRWTSSTPQTNQWFKVNMLTRRTFDQITLDSGTSTTQYLRGYRVEISDDDSVWTIVATGTGSSALVTINLAPARTAKFIRITATTSNSSAWTIQEMNVSGAGLSSLGWVAKAKTTSGSNVAGNAIDSSASTRWTSLTPQTGEWFSVDMGTAQTFNQLALDSGMSASTQFPRAYTVEVSNDGTNWGTPVATGTGTSRVVTVTFATQTARHFRITQTSADTSAWSIQDLTVWRTALLCDTVTCAASNDCHVAGVCDINTGLCSNPPKADWTPCGTDTNVCNGIETCRGGACLPEPAGSGTTCSGPTRVTFYQSFDGGTQPTIALSPQTVIQNLTAFTQAPGLFGSALNQSADNTMSYYTPDLGANPANIVLSKPGSVSMWVKPNGPYFGDAVLFQAYSSALQLFVYDHPTGVAATLTRADGLGQSSVGASASGPPNWRADDRWHLIVVNWSQNGISVSVDGVWSATQDAAWLRALPGWRGSQNSIFVGPYWAGAGNHILKDEVIILNRPMTTQEADWYFAQRDAHPMPNPAIAHFDNTPATCNPADDLNPCTTDTCDPVAGYQHANASGAACNDGNACTQTDICQNGTCVGTGGVTCTAPECHTVGQCVPGVGCPAPVAKAQWSSCSDGQACNGFETCQGGSCTPEAPGALTTCSGPTAITFHLGYEDGLTADIARGAASPNVNYPIVQAPGLFGGQAMDSSTPGFFDVDYQSLHPSPANILFSKPGSVSLWVKPGPQYTPSSFFDAGDSAALLVIADYGFAIGATAGGGSSYVGNSANWATTNQWHLLVVNWTAFGFVLWVDGVPGPVFQWNAPQAFEQNGAYGHSQIWLGGGGGGYLRDEVMVLNRPLTADEITWYYEQRKTAATENPAIDRFSDDPTTCNAGDDLNPCTADACGANGAVTHTNLSDVSCSDGNACTQNDMCHNGVCTPGAAPTCSATQECDSQLGCVERCPVHQNSCMGPATRDPVTGACTYAALPDGAGCNDRNACTQTDTCQQGVCTGANPVSCAGSSGGGQCETAGICNPSTGTCVNVPVPDGFGCNDGNPCTQTDSCRNGTCVGEDPKVCTTSDQCHSVGTCDPTTGQCSNPAVANGTPCDDGSACTETDTCTAGSCGGVSTCATAQMSPEEAESAVLFEVVGLSTGPNDAEIATGINSSGTVVGYNQNPDGRTWAWFVTTAGIGWPVPNTLDGGAKAYGINDAAIVVGDIDPGHNPVGTHSVGTFPNVLTIPHGHPFRQFGGTAGGLPPVDILGSPFYGSARGINGIGDMVATLYDVNGTTFARFVPGDPFGSPPALVQIPSNPHFTGVSVGVGIGPGPGAMMVGGAETFEEMNVGPPDAQRNIKMFDAFSYSPTKGFRNLNDIPASRSGSDTWKLQVATATNGKQIVGWGSFGSTGNRVCHAFRLTPVPGADPFIQPGPPIPGSQPSPPPTVATLIDLGTMTDHGPGHCNSFGNAPYIPDAINSRGEVVGSVRSTPSSQGGAFFYSDATGMIDLTEAVRRTYPTAGYSLKTASGINDRGQIVGTFTTPGNTRVRAYRLTLPPTFTSGPTAQFDWKMKPHFPGSDRKMPAAPVTNWQCPASMFPCYDWRGSPGCASTPLWLLHPDECVALPCQPGRVGFCRTSCGSVGTQTCGSDGHWGMACTAGTEICDGSDNDCNGQVDEDSICTRPRSSVDPTKRGFDVTLEAAPSFSPKMPIVECTWDIPGVVQGATGCTTNVVFPQEGPFSVTLTVATENHKQASITRDVNIRNVIIVSIGDSIASGEGAPDVPGSLDRPVTWWNHRCHRSLRSHHALTARAIEEADPKTSVTFISRACSGASILGGLRGNYGGSEPLGIIVPDTTGDLDSNEFLRPQTEAIQLLLGTRKPDVLLMQVGANDARFSAVIEKCTSLGPPEAPVKLFFAECESLKQNGVNVADALRDTAYGGLFTTLGTLGPSLPEIVGSDTKIYIADYPDPMRASPVPPGLCRTIALKGAIDDKFPLPASGDGILLPEDIEYAALNFLPRLNGAIAYAASERGWTHITGMNPEFVGKSMCSADSAFMGYQESLDKEGIYKGVFHPNDKGHRIYASKMCPKVAGDLGFSAGRCPTGP